MLLTLGRPLHQCLQYWCLNYNGYRDVLDLIKIGSHYTNVLRTDSAKFSIKHSHFDPVGPVEEGHVRGLSIYHLQQMYFPSWDNCRHCGSGDNTRLD